MFSFNIFLFPKAKKGLSLEERFFSGCQVYAEVSVFDRGRLVSYEKTHVCYMENSLYVRDTKADRCFFNRHDIVKIRSTGGVLHMASSDGTFVILEILAKK